MNATQASLWEIQEQQAPASDLPPFVDLPISWAGGERSLDELARVILGDLQVTRDKKHFYQITATGIIGDLVIAHYDYLSSVRAFYGGSDEDQTADEEEAA